TSNCTAPGCAALIDFYKGLQGPQDRQGNQWLGLSRIDWNATPRNQISSTINILRWDSPNGIQTAPTHRFHASANGSDIVKNETVITRWNAVVRPTFVSELRFQWGRDFEAQDPNAGGPYVAVTNGIDIGMPDFLPRPAYPDERRWQVAHNLSWLRGRHSIKFGYDINWVKDELINLFQGGGVYSYSTLNDLALDCLNPSLPLGNCQATPTTGPQGVTGKHYSSFTQAFDTLALKGAAKFSNQDYGFYVEDSFKPKPNLTVNLGLRYDLETIPTPNAPNSLVPGTARINTDKNNFGPRFGLSWDPFKKQKTVVRIGAGMFYGRTQNSTISSLLKENGQRQQSFQFLPSTPGSLVFPQVFSGIPPGTAGRPDSLFASSDFASPLTYQLEFTVEQELTRNLTFTASYLSTRGQRLPFFRDINLFKPTDVATYTVCAVPQVGSSTTCSQVERNISVPFFPGPSSNRPNPAFGRITTFESVVNSWYNGLVLQAKHRFSHGFQMQASFTYSKSQDDDQISQTFFSANQPLNPFNVRDDYSVSNFDQRKRFTLTSYWMLPFHRIGSRPLRAALDWFQLSGILTLADGRPYNGFLSGNPSPSGVGTGILGAGGSSRVPWYGRNVFVNPGLATTDLRLARAFKFGERMKLDLIAEAFNLFNRVNISGINTTQYNVRGSVLFPNPAFNSISATGTNLTRERQLQLGGRFTF
ncbi:MAG: TonB-dependent receptor, partial [Acidobacteria bacterium]|nr:TonB-dependent receptor [Acidobacteriota bacterium]